MKKVACLNIITKVIKESKSDIKNQIKSAKAQNKNNFNKFIHDMTNTCINIIKEKEVKQILNIENFENKNFHFGKKEIQFDEHLARFFEDNEIFKKIEEIIELKKQRKKMIINTTCIAIIVLIALVVALAWVIGLSHHNVKNLPITREAKLYAIKTDEVPVFKDSLGVLWEIDWLKNVTADDNVLLEIVNDEVTRAWVEVINNGDEEIPQS
jgi:hypothetical protein